MNISGNKTILLMSGLTLDHPTSFSRQLGLLRMFMKKRGMNVVLSGPISGSTPFAHLLTKDTQDDKYSDIERLIKKTRAQAVILLGYPDQFSFLKKIIGIPIPFFLWAQFSSTIDRRILDHIILVPLTEKTEHFLEKSGIKNIGPIIPHGVDTSLYHPFPDEKRHEIKERSGLKDLFVIGTVGANSARKRLDRIIESFALFSKKRDGGFLLIKTDRVLSLDGIDLKANAEKYGMLHATWFITDDLTDEQMQELYNTMDIYINLSEWEGFCIPVIESMSCGVPVASQPIQGPGEIVPYKELIIQKSTILHEGERTLYFANPKEVSNILLKAYNNRLLLKDLSAIGRKTAENIFDIRAVARKWEELILNYCAI